MSKIDLEGKRGDTWYWQFTVLQADKETAQDITGATFRFTAKGSPADADVDAVIAGTSAGGECSITSAADGEMSVKIGSAATAVLSAPRVLSYDLQAQDSGGDVYTVAWGALRVSIDISITAP